MRWEYSFAILSVAMVVLSGCASVSVRDVAKVGEGRPVEPERIYVADFEAPESLFRVDRSGESLDTFIANFQRNLSEGVARRVGKHLVPSEAVERERAFSPQPAWLVSGRFERVNQGSRALRMTLGLGAGGSKVETRVVVYDLSGRKPQPILTFETTGGSNAGPGAIFNTNPWMAGASAAGLMMSGLSYDAVRTSREVTAVLSEYMAEQGFIDPKRMRRSKKLGEWP